MSWTLSQLKQQPSLGEIQLSAKWSETVWALGRENETRAYPSLLARKECGLTPRSSGVPTAGHQARSVGTRNILHSPGLASCRRHPLSSNVRHQSNRNVLNLARRASKLDLPAALALLAVADEVCAAQTFSLRLGV